MGAFSTIIRQDLRLAFRKGSGASHLLAFFIISAILFAFGVGSDPDLLKSIGNGVIWVCALLSSMLAVPKVFDEDFEDGTLALIFLQGELLEKTMLAKMVSHWLIACVPLIVISPFLAALFHIEDRAFTLVLALTIGTPTLCSIGAMGAALTLGIKRGSGLVGIIILPLYIPVLIFGAAADITILFALLLLMLPVSVFASSAAVRMALEE